MKENVFITIMLLTCFKLFYIKDNSVENSVDFTKYKHNGVPPSPTPPISLSICDIIYTCYYEL